MMEMLPYGANILVSSKSTTLGNKFPLQQPDFISGSSEPVTITYDYTEENGILIGIDTNLRYELDTENHTFLLSNDNIFGTNEKPYIKLLCNHVFIPISFIDHDGTGNKWTSENTSYSNKIRLNGYYSGNYVDITKGYYISWNRQESSQTIFIGKNTGGGGAYGEYYACEAFYQFLNSNGQVENGNSTIWSVSGQAPNGVVTIPKLNGELSEIRCGNTVISRKFINYFALGVQVKILDGYSTYQANTRFYIEGNNRIYNNTSTITEISIPQNRKAYLISDKVPNYSYSDAEYKWNTDFFYKLETKDSSNNDILISPSTSQIKYDWLFDCIEHNS